MTANANRRLLIAIVLGTGLGIAARALFPESAALTWALENVVTPIGHIFLRLLFMLVVPLLFSALVVGVCDIDLRSLGRIGIRTLLLTAAVSTAAVVLGVLLVNGLRPGDAISPDALSSLRGGAAGLPTPKPLEGSAAQMLVAMVPDNIIRVASQGDMIGLIVFALFFGTALATLRDSGPAARVREVLTGIYEVMMRLIDWVMKLAPIGVGALLFSMGARLGPELLLQLAAFVGVVVLGLSLHMFGTYSLALMWLGKKSPLRFFREVRVAMVTSFSTASSSATLPTALKVAEEELRLPPHVSRFVLTAGAAMNQNGTALFEGVTVLFLAQLFDVELGLTQQLVVMVICVLGGIGTAGVPAASIPVIAMILGMFAIPVEGLGLILGVDRFLDMCRTVVNVTGDLAVAVCVSEGEKGQTPASPPVAGA